MDSYKKQSHIETREIDPTMNKLTEAVIGAAIEVHRHLGPGYLEATYEQALCIELNLRGIAFDRQHPIHLIYKGHPVGEGKLDLLVDRRLIVELKAVDVLNHIHEAQVISYLKATGYDLGLLINFNVSTLVDGVKRIVYTKSIHERAR